jgi:phage gp36-like protein
MSAAYASLDDLVRYGAPATAFATLTTDQKQAALNAAADEVDRHIRARYPLPLVAWDASITEITAVIATYRLMDIRGLKPGSSGTDNQYEARYNRALRQLELIQKQQLHPDVTPQPSMATRTEQPAVFTSSVVNLSTGESAHSRGW